MYIIFIFLISSRLTQTEASLKFPDLQRGKGEGLPNTKVIQYTKYILGKITLRTIPSNIVKWHVLRLCLPIALICLMRIQRCEQNLFRHVNIKDMGRKHFFRSKKLFCKKHFLGIKKTLSGGQKTLSRGQKPFSGGQKTLSRGQKTLSAVPKNGHVFYV